MKPIKVLTLMIALLLTTCSRPISVPSRDLSQASLALTHATLIDGTGAAPHPDATLVIGGGRILAVGAASQVRIPSGVEVIDLGGATILPGFINAHVHDAFDPDRLEAWAQAGVTTVRDESILSFSETITQLIGLRDELAISPQYARLVSAGYMLSTPDGYGMLEVTSAQDARRAVNTELNQGADMIKLAVESGYAGVTNLPLLSADELKAIVESAHDRGVRVSAHITDAGYLPLLLEAGVDDLAHIPAGFILKSQIQEMIDQDMYVVTTLTVFEAYGGLDMASATLKKLVESGVHVAMGNDYTLVPQNNFDHFDLGMPLYELTRMHEAGMTNLQIIVASTKNAAYVCGLENELGTLEAGKLADILVIGGNPIDDLASLKQVKLVIHSGEIIRR